MPKMEQHLINARFAPYLYEEMELDQAISKFAYDMKATRIPELCKKADLFTQYSTYRNDSASQRRNYDLMREIGTVLKEHNVFDFVINSRIKSLIRYDGKSTLSQADGSLSPIYDIIGYKIIFFANKPGECFEKMAFAVHTVIEIAKAMNFDVITANPAKDLGAYKGKNLVVLPSKNLISEEDRPFTKDYVTISKKNGYQAYHLILCDKISGHFFEVQIKDIFMNFHADFLEANHGDYADERKLKQMKIVNPYLQMVPIELDKVKIKGFLYQKAVVAGKETPLIADHIGLISHIVGHID